MEIIDNLSNTKPNVPKRDHEGSGGVLAMGILSIVLCGLIGVILGIIAITKANTAIHDHSRFPEKYTESSLSRMKAGKVCGIIGIALLGLIIIFVVLGNLA